MRFIPDLGKYVNLQDLPKEKIFSFLESLSHFNAVAILILPGADFFYVPNTLMLKPITFETIFSHSYIANITFPSSLNLSEAFYMLMELFKVVVGIDIYMNFNVACFSIL